MTGGGANKKMAALVPITILNGNESEHLPDAPKSIGGRICEKKGTNAGFSLAKSLHLA